MADAAPARRAGRVRCFRRPAPAASRHGWPSNSWAAGAVDTAAVLGQALRLWKQLQRNSSRIPEPPWLLVLLKECMDNEEGSFIGHGAASSGVRAFSLLPVDSEEEGQRIQAQLRLVSPLCLAHREKPSRARSVQKREMGGVSFPLPPFCCVSSTF